ncbi:MAG: SDR family oxidoreductase [Schumannella sp.]
MDGFKVADPLIMAYGRGLLPEFPGLPDSILDVIPVDYVVNAILAAAANPAAKKAPEYYHVASGSSNPLPFHEIYGFVNRFFTANPMKDKQAATSRFRSGSSRAATRSRRPCCARSASRTPPNGGSADCPTPTGCAGGTTR